MLWVRTEVAARDVRHAIVGPIGMGGAATRSAIVRP